MGAVLAGELHVLLTGVLLKEVASLTHKSDLIIELYGSSEPVGDSQVGRGGRGGRFEAGHPVTGVQQGAGTPALVPLAAHGLARLVLLVPVKEHPGRATLVSEVCHVIPGDESVVVSRFLHQVCSPGLHWDDRVEEAVDGDGAVVLRDGLKKKLKSV